MTHIKFIALFLLLLPVSVSAAQLKIAYVNAVKVIEEAPQASQASTCKT